jgi:hypothetical protein
MTPGSSAPDSKWRERAGRALEKYFAQRSAPRLILSLILVLTGLASLVVSLELLRAGLVAMWVRYPLAVLAGYGVFIGLLRLWIEFERKRFDPQTGEIDNLVTSIPLQIPESDWKERLPRNRWYDWLDLPGGFDLDEGCLIAVLLGVVVTLMGLAVFAVLSAQAFIAEVFLDAFIVSALYRRLRIAAQEHWLGTAVRKTWMLALMTAALLSLAGWCLEIAAPGSHSIGPASEQLLHGSPQNSPLP